jgi:GT2 family glycosyltransferase
LEALATFKIVVTFGINTVVVVQHRQYIVRSEDNRESFDNATSVGSGNNLWGVGGNNTFVAVGVDESIVRSTDGTNWDNATSPTSEDLRGVTF